MPEMDKNANDPAVAGGQTVDPPGKNLGSLLRAARERKGHSQRDLAEIIRLRLFYVDAIEKEDWNRLPAPVFIKGFIKSYARAVGLNEKEVLKLYQEQTPDTGIPRSPEIRKERTGLRKVYAAGGIFCLAVFSVLMIYLGTGSGHKSQLPNHLTPASLLPPDPAPGPTSTPVSETDKRIKERPEPGSLTTDGQSSANVPVPVMMPQTAESSPGGAAIKTEPKQASAGGWNLKATARKATWINLYRDQEPPRDYLFMAGDKKEWHAQSGFVVIVGNAAGMDFELNGIRYENLGEPNQVVKLKFPEGFERHINAQ